MDIRRYETKDETALMAMIRAEGDEWICYWGDDVAAAYRKALAESITYVAVEDGAIIGYSRSLPDHGFYVYVCDLLVAKPWRGRAIGRRLMEVVVRAHPGQTVYVMSDVDGYYRKLGYHREGSVFEVLPPDPEPPLRS
jgi:GNAT superfamily N-acetyltransferase